MIAQPCLLYEHPVVDYLFYPHETPLVPAVNPSEVYPAAQVVHLPSVPVATHPTTVVTQCFVDWFKYFPKAHAEHPVEVADPY